MTPTEPTRCRRCGDLIGDRGVPEPYPTEPGLNERVHWSCRIDAIQARGRLEVAASFKLRAGAERMLQTLLVCREWIAQREEPSAEAMALLIEIEATIAEATL